LQAARTSRCKCLHRRRHPTENLSEPATPEIYLPFWQSGAFEALVVRTTSDPTALAALVRSELRTIDPTSAVERMTTMAAIRRESVAPRTFAMRLLIGFAVVATVLAVVGLYGVLSLSVNSRIKEIAVRKPSAPSPARSFSWWWEKVRRSWLPESWWA
jgi:putative ABC transport system permease protein